MVTNTRLNILEPILLRYKIVASEAHDVCVEESANSFQVYLKEQIQNYIKLNDIDSRLGNEIE